MSSFATKGFAAKSIFAATVTTLGATAANAHHPMGGATPSNFTEGFLSGVGHPVIGFDHLAFVIAVGLASAFIGARYLMPLFFVAATAVGCLMVALMGVAFPAGEMVIAASIVALGAVVMSGRTLPTWMAAALFAGAGLFHGGAYAAAIIGAEQTPLLAYLAGFGLVQYAIAAAVVFVVHQVWRATDSLAIQPRLAAAVVAGVGATFLIEHVEAIAFPGVS